MKNKLIPSEISHLKQDSVIILGTGTCQLQKHRVATSSLITLNKKHILYDCGRGVTQRLAELELKQDDLNHIVISHFHPDHISDLIPYLQAASWSRIDSRTSPLNIYGPFGLENQMMRMIGAFDVDNLIAYSV